MEDNGRVLRIDWANEDHVSRFEASYLADLRAAPDVLPIRRQTWDRDSLAAGFMKPMVANLSQKDMIDLAAYVGSLRP